MNFKFFVLLLANITGLISDLFFIFKYDEKLCTICYVLEPVNDHRNYLSKTLKTSVAQAR